MTGNIAEPQDSISGVKSELNITQFQFQIQIRSMSQNILNKIYTFI